MQSSLDCMQTLGFVRVKKEVDKGIRERENCFKVIVKSAVLVLKKIFETLKINFLARKGVVFLIG